jgi:hypothetical protein
MCVDAGRLWYAQKRDRAAVIDAALHCACKRADFQGKFLLGIRGKANGTQKLLMLRVRFLVAAEQLFYLPRRSNHARTR